MDEGYFWARVACFVLGFITGYFFKKQSAIADGRKKTRR